MGETDQKKIDYERYVKYAQILEKTKWADEFSWEEIKIICHYIRPVIAQKGAVVFKEGAKEQSFGLIVKGGIDIYKGSGTEKKKVTSLRNSQTFGEMALLDGEPRSATGIANKDSIVFFISKNNLLEIAADHPKLGFQILWKISKLISQHLRKTTGQLVDFLEAG